jgi:hypothetical protein
MTDNSFVTTAGNFIDGYLIYMMVSNQRNNEYVFMKFDHSCRVETDHWETAGQAPCRSR